MRDDYMGETSHEAPLASPVFSDLAGLPPMLVQVGNIETLLDDALALHQRAINAGVDSTLEVWDDMVHVWHAYAHRLADGQRAIERIGRFLGNSWSPA